MGKRYVFEYDHSVYSKEKSKDDIIQAMAGLLNGDGVVQIKITYPDGSYYEWTDTGE